MKKFFTLIAAVAMAASMNAQTLSFDKDYAVGSVPAIFSANGCACLLLIQPANFL